jgi:XTP/dITP diphosphohydrolase
MQVLLATGNARKVAEARLGCALFGITVESVAVPYQEIQSQDPLEIALHKSHQAFAHLQQPVVVADTFWTIPALNGFPGAYMKEVTRWFGPQDFLTLIHPYADRRVCFTETVVYREATQHQVFSQQYWGVFSPAPRGEGLSIEQVAAFNGQTIAERRTHGLYSHEPAEFVWAEFAAWYSGTRQPT